MNIKNKILVIDDDPVGLNILVDHLMEFDYEVDSVKDGKQAWDLLINNPLKYNVIILDRMLEDLDGIELLVRIKNQKSLANIPVIIQTSEANSEEYIDAVKQGAFDFIYKPVEKKLLMYVVKNALEKEFLEKQKSFDDF